MTEPIFNIKRDAKRLAVVIAIIIIPIMYSFFFLDAFWDPYSKLDKLPVAVVNEDKGATINSEQKNAGNELVDELKDNNKLKWIFTSKAEADQGLKDRKYYAIIEIPENFSSNIATAETKDKLQGILIYQPQQKRNYLASQILSKAVMELENKVSENITKEMVQYIADENKKLPDNLKELSDGLDKIQKDGTDKLEDGLNELIDNQIKYNSGMEKASEAFSKTGSATKSLYIASNTLTTGARTFADSLSSKAPQLQKLSDGSDTIKNSLNALNTGLLQLNSGASLMSSKLPELQTGIQKYNLGLKAYTQGLKAFGEGIAPLATQLQPLKTGSEQYLSSISSYSEKMGELDKGVSQYLGSVKTLTSTNKDVAEKLTAYVKEHPEAMTDKNIQSIIATFQKSQGSLDQLDTASDSVQKSISALSTGSQQLVAGSKQLNDGVTKFVDGAPKLSQAAAQLSAGADSLADGGDKISASLDTLSGSAPKIVQAISKLSDGSTKINDGYTKIDAGIKEASSGMTEAASVANKIATGNEKLNTGISKAKNGIDELNSASKKFPDGEKELRDGAAKLGDKVKEANDKIADKQQEANDKVAKLDGLADYVSDPVKIEEKPIDPVDGYGTAFAPYFISLSLWVGALIMFVMIYLNPQMRFKKKVVKNAHMDVKLLMYPALGVAQALGLGIVLINVLHLKPTDMSMFFVVTTLTSLCFISIEQFLIVHLGDVGKFLVILLLIFQLTSSGGTFPNELVPKFFNAINQFMPMTYSIYALKETISGHNSAFLNQNMLVLTIIMVVFLIASLLLAGRKKAKSLDDIESEFVHKREGTTIQG